MLPLYVIVSMEMNNNTFGIFFIAICSLLLNQLLLMCRHNYFLLFLNTAGCSAYVVWYAFCFQIIIVSPPWLFTFTCLKKKIISFNLYQNSQRNVNLNQHAYFRSWKFPPGMTIPDNTCIRYPKKNKKKLVIHCWNSNKSNLAKHTFFSGTRLWETNFKNVGF